MKVDVYSQKGDKVSDIELKAEVFEQKINQGLIYQVIRAEMANVRQGDASTKTRAEVRGGGIKPWRQKGTGRARAGSIRSPLFVGGGTVFGPQPKVYSLTIPRKMKKVALRSILSAKANGNEIKVVDKLDFKEPKTKLAKDTLDKLKLSKKVTVVTEGIDENTFKSFQNLPKTNILSVDMISPYFILDNDALVITKDALQKLTEVLS